jgi:hypothetical protein
MRTGRNGSLWMRFRLGAESFFAALFVRLFTDTAFRRTRIRSREERRVAAAARSPWIWIGGTAIRFHGFFRKRRKGESRGQNKTRWERVIDD